MRPRTRRKPLWIRALGGAAYLLFCLVALSVGAVAGWMGQSAFIKEVVRQDLLGTEPEEVFNGSDHVTLLILGCDEDRYYGGKQVLREKARSDMMLVARLDFASNRITGLSIPRDTLASPDGYRPQKINAYHLIGGPELAKAAVEDVLPGVVIDRVVVLDFKAFEEMVDLAGGVELDVPRRMKYEDVRGGLHIDLSPGRQRLSGSEAVGFVRYRHGDDDFRRQGRQKAFMLAFKEAVMAKPGVLPQVAQKAREVMGGALTDQEVASLVLFAKAVGNENIKMGMLPTVPARGYNLRVDRARLAGTLRDFMLVEPGPVRVSSLR